MNDGFFNNILKKDDEKEPNLGMCGRVSSVFVVLLQPLQIVHK
jgi:hypothetical protein